MNEPSKKLQHYAWRLLNDDFTAIDFYNMWRKRPKGLELAVASAKDRYIDLHNTTPFETEKNGILYVNVPTGEVAPQYKSLFSIPAYSKLFFDDWDATKATFTMRVCEETGEAPYMSVRLAFVEERKLILDVCPTYHKECDTVSDPNAVLDYE